MTLGPVKSAGRFRTGLHREISKAGGSDRYALSGRMLGKGTNASVRFADSGQERTPGDAHVFSDRTAVSDYSAASGIFLSRSQRASEAVSSSRWTNDSSHPHPWPPCG